ncbi:hypothetical protein RHPLAN_47060 [Rhodoplanes sp. Z2-YC6860]|nr:hypothetical protein RHPLAN_47060 [Rhodoplanes sp. Z2-YC6860]
MAPVVETDIAADATTLSWGAVIAGAVASAAMTLLLLALGVGLGLSVVSPWSDQGVSASTFSVGAGLFMIAVAMLSSTVGGYLAGRLRSRWALLNDNEVYFRDTAHGFVAWALATVFSIGVLGGAITHLVAGAAPGVAPAVSAVAPSDPSDLLVDAMLRPDASASSPARLDNPNFRDEMKRAAATGLREGKLSPATRTYMARVIAARTGLNQADAEQRADQALNEVKEATDKARKAAAHFALWLAAAMLAGAVFAMLGAVEGGVLRDSRWWEPGWRNTLTRTH